MLSMPSVSTALQQWMLEKDVSAIKLAMDLGLREVTVLRWLRGKTVPSKRMIKKLDVLTKGVVRAPSYTQLDLPYAT